MNVILRNEDYLDENLKKYQSSLGEIFNSWDDLLIHWRTTLCNIGIAAVICLWDHNNCRFAYRYYLYKHSMSEGSERIIHII